MELKERSLTAWIVKNKKEKSTGTFEMISHAVDTFGFGVWHLCPSRILFLDAYTVCIVHWLSVGHASDLHWAYWLVCPDVHSKCEWALWSLFYSDYLFDQAIVYFSFHFAWSHYACLICVTSFSTYNDHIVLLCFRRFLFICFKSYSDSRVRYEWVLFNCSQLTC